jgi:cell division protein FtsQ
MKLKIIFITILLSIVCIGLLATVFLKNDNKNEICGKLTVTFNPIGGKNYVTENMVFNLLNINKLNPINRKISEINLAKIREIIESGLAVKKAKCYFTKNGDLKIDIVQRKPFFKVIGAKTYYVDTDIIIFETAHDFNAEVPTVRGNVSVNFAKNELFDFIKYIENDNFFSILIDKIYVENESVKLVPLIGNQTIIVGKLKNQDDIYDYEKKIERLSQFYSKGVLNKIGWEKYSEIDLRFDKQIVCR